MGVAQSWMDECQRGWRRRGREDGDDELVKQDAGCCRHWPSAAVLVVLLSSVQQLIAASASVAHMYSLT